MSIPACAKYAIIRETSAREGNLLNIKWLCTVAGVSRSGYYHYLTTENLRRQREEQDRRDFDRIVEAYRFRGYDKGARGIYMRLAHLDPPVIMNLKKIRRLMNKYGLKCPIRKAPRCYLSTILDGCTKELLAWMLSESLEVDFVLDTVTQLIEKHGVSLSAKALIHSDQGAHYTSVRFTELVKDKQLRQSMSRRANCWDNAPQESFFGHMKDEIDLSGCATSHEIWEAISRWADYYNNERYQWDLARLSPAEYYNYLKTGKYPLNLPATNGRSNHTAPLPELFSENPLCP